MSSKIDIKLLKVIDAGHFKASPIAAPGSELENFMGQLNDYFLHEKDPHGLSVVPQKGKMYAVQRTMDHCWYRARILNIMQTTAGPQASVLLVDVEEQTLIPCSRTCELPKQFENIPYQVMDCRLIAVKPLRLVTSYFDLTTTKQVSDSWTEAATKFVHSVISGCKLEVTIQREDDDGHYYVLLHATSPRKQVCVNDELVQQGFAVFTEIEDESPRKAERRKLQQEQFMQQQQQVVDAFKNHATLPYHGESTSTDEEGLSSFRANIMQRDTTVQSSLNFLRQQVAEIRQPIHGNEPVSMIPAGSENTGLSNRKTRQSPKALSSSSDDNSGRVRFVSARIPATGSGVPSLSREDDSARLKSILKTGKPTSLSTNRGEEHVATKSQWHPGQDTNISPQNPGQDMNVSSQYTGQDRGVSSHYPGQERGVSPQYPGQDRGVSQQYPGQDRGASQQYPGQENGVSPQYPGQDKGVSPQYPGQDRGVSTQYPGQDRGVSQQYPEQDIGVSPQYPGQDTNISPQYPEQDRGVSPQYPGSETYKSQQYPSRERDLPQQYPQTNNRTQWHPSQSASYEETLHNQPPLYPGPSSDRVHNASPQYPGQETDRLNNASSHYPGQQSDRMNNTSPQYPGPSSERMYNDSPQYPGPSSEQMNNASLQYPGQQSDRVHNASPQYPGPSERMNNTSTQYPGAQSDRVHNASPQYPGPSEIINNTSPLHPGKSALSSILGVVQNTSSSTDSQGFSKPTQPLPSHTGQSSSDSSHYHPQENTMSSRLPSLALSQRLPSDALSQNPRLPSEAVNQKSDSTQQTNECESSIDDGVLVHGEGAPKPYLSMDNCPLHEKGTRLNIRVPTPLQRHMWPALLRGRDVAGIASRNAGKKLAYLLPIIDQVMESSAYSELPLTNGPLALILCSNWSDAIEIYQECNKILGNRRTARVHVIFGGGAEDEQIVPVLNGCEVLVATVPCFLRMFKHGYSPLDRLCHIVFDDADILVEDFTSELKDIMRVYGRHLVSQPGRVAPRQAVIMATSWTVGVASLTHAYLGNPLIIIDDQVEAAFYSGVKQTVELCSTNQRLTRLIGFLDNADRTHEIVVFTNTAQEAESLAEILRTNNHFVLVAHEFMQPQNLADIRRQWYTPHSEDLMPILVLTDGVLMGRQLTIHNASMVIHYDLPLSKNKEKFGQRFFCMARTFTATKDHGCLSVIFITENCMRQATIAHELVRRTLQLNPSEDMSVNSNNPQTINTTLLEQMAETAQMAKERDKANFDLCDFMMAYGTCRTFADKKKCTMRHMVLREEDYPYDLPTMGIVRVLVLYVLNATCLWVRILEHRNPKGEVISSSSSSKFVQMTIDMGVWYGNPDNRKKISMPRESDMCAIELDGSYHRVKVCGIVHSSSQSGMPLDTQVHFVDTGLYDVVKVSSLLQLPQQFHTLPFQAVQVFVCRVKPQDKSLQWTPKANSFVKNLVEGKELEGKVVLSLGNTMWLDPLWEKKVLKSINVTTNINNIRIELLKKGLAVENKQHIKQLRKLCDDAIDLSIYDGTEGEGALGGDSSSTLETVTLSEDDYQDVYVSAVDTPGLFFVQLASYKSLLEELQTKIDGGISCVQFEEDDEFAIGSLCVACFTNNDMWYRARVLGIRPDNEYDVFYVDYGDREWIPRGRLRPAWSDILTLPLQAIECSLVNIIPLENDWTPADGDALWDRCEDRLLFVKVKSKVASLMSGCHRFVVELVDTSTSIDVNFSDELVATGHAQTSPEGIQTLFPEAAVQLTREDYKYEYEKIPDMCRDILQSRDPSQRVSIAKSLQTVVLNSLNAKDAVREGGGVRSICRLLALTRSMAVQEHLLVSLECLTFQNDSNCDEVRREGGLKSLCQLMEKSRNLAVKEHVAWTVKNLAATDKNKDALREMGGIGILCKELDDAMDEKVQEQITWALEVLAYDNTKNCQVIYDNGGIRMLSQLVSNTSHEIVLDRATRALAALATEPSNRNVIRLDGGLLAICKRIQDDPSEDFLRVASGALKTVVSNNQHNKEVMKDIGMVHTLQKITSSSTYSSITRRLCCDLLERLIGWAAAGFSASPTKTSAPTTPMTTPTTAPTTTTIVNGTTGSPHSNQVNLGDDIPPLEGSDDDDDNRKKRQVNGTEEVKKVIKVKKQQPLLRPQPKRKQETSDDSDEQDQTDKSYHPFTTWSQTKDTLRIAVRLRGVKKQITDLHDNRLTFSTKLHGKKYHLELDLYDSVITEEKQVDIKGDEVMIVLKKSKSVAWPRLIQSKEKLAYLSIDFDRWEVWSSSEEEQDNNKKKPFVYLPPKPLSTNNVNKKCIVPEMDNTSESSSSDSDGDLGYHGMIDFS